MAPAQLQPLPPEEAIAFFRGKGLQESFDYRDVWKEEHARAFTVAKAMRRDVLMDLRDAVDRALAEGRTFEQFRKDLTPLLKEKGWWGRQQMTDPLDGESRSVQLGSTRRLRTIFDTNLRTAYQAGRWKRIQATKDTLPFLRYVAVQDARTRPEHKAWHGTVKPIGDPWWNTHYPPCGFRCRCTTIQINQRTMERRGWSVTEDPPRFPPVSYINPRTGEAAVLERGIDPGFDVNVGQAWLAPVTPRAGIDLPGPAAIARGPMTPVPARPGAQPLPIGATAEEGQGAFLGRLGFSPGSTGLFIDSGSEPFPVGPALFTSASGNARRLAASRVRGLPSAAEAIVSPDEIRWVWSDTPKPMMLRRYIRRIDQGDGRAVDVVVDAAAGGAAPWWSFRTSLDGRLDLDAFRTGVLAWRRPPAGQLEALGAYTDAIHHQINDYLRLGDQSQAEAMAHWVEGLDRLLAGRFLTDTFELWRGVQGQGAAALMARPIRKGMILRDLGFMSTSFEPDVAYGFQGIDPTAILLKVIARAGANAMDVTHLSDAGTGEYEVLFARGVRLRVISWDRKTRTLTVETVIGRTE